MRKLRSLNRFQAISIIFTVVIALAVVIVGLGAISAKDSILVSGDNGYSITGEFAVDGTPRLKKQSVKLARSQGSDLVLWGSWLGNDNHTGQLISPPFKAPPIFSLFVSGYYTVAVSLPPNYPTVPGNRLYLEREDTHEIKQLKVGSPGKRWQELSWSLPIGWWGHPVRVIAIDNLEGSIGAWLGISSPLKTSLLSFLGRQISSLALVPIYLIHTFLFLVLGLTLAWLIVQKQNLNPAFTPILGIGIIAFESYVTFWAYFLNRGFGIAFSVGVTVLSIVFAVYQHRQKQLAGLFSSKDVFFPLLLMLVIGLGYLSVLYGIDTGDQPELLAQIRFFDQSFPPDNVLPKILADRLYSADDPRPLIEGWQSSDRPPLQAGLFLLLRPLAGILGFKTGFHYQIIGTIAQCSWVAAVWALCRVLQLSFRHIAIVMAFCIFSGFCFFHSLFVWPKLLPASLVVFACALLLPSVYESRRPSTVEAGLATSAGILGMLAHGGVVFTLPAIALMLVRPKSFPGIKQIVISLAIICILLAPWTAYQKLYDPPANRLIKWHLAGVSDPSDPRSSLQTIIDSYQTTELSQIIHNKWTNLTELVGPLPEIPKTSYGRRSQEYFYVFHGLGVLNVGWLVYLWLWIKRPAATRDFFRRVSVVFGVILGSVVFWVLIMFGPAATTIHLGSFATMTLLFTATASLVALLPRLLVYALLSFQIAKFIIDWVIKATVSSDTTLMPTPNFWLLGLAIALTTASIAILHALSVERSRSDLPETLPHKVLTQKS